MDNILAFNRSKTIEELIAEGGYHCPGNNIKPDNFHKLGSGIERVEHKLFTFDHDLYRGEAMKLIRREGWWFPQIQHLLVFGIKHPQPTEDYPIIALGSVDRSNGLPLIPCIQRKEVDLSFGIMPAGFQFLAIKDIRK